MRRIEKPVDVIEAQALQRAARDQPPDQCVDRGECRLVLDPQPGERADVEEASVVEVGRGQPPMRQPIMLALEQTMQIGHTAFPVRRPECRQATRDHIAAAACRQRGFQSLCRLTREPGC